MTQENIFLKLEDPKYDKIREILLMTDIGTKHKHFFMHASMLKVFNHIHFTTSDLVNDKCQYQENIKHLFSLLDEFQRITSLLFMLKIDDDTLNDLNNKIDSGDVKELESVLRYVRGRLKTILFDGIDVQINDMLIFDKYVLNSSPLVECIKVRKLSSNPNMYFTFHELPDVYIHQFARIIPEFHFKDILQLHYKMYSNYKLITFIPELIK